MYLSPLKKLVFMAMITVKIKTMPPLTEIVKGRQISVTLPENSSVAKLIDQLSIKYETDAFRKISKGDKNQGLDSLTIYLNGRNILFLNGSETRLGDKDELFFLSPVGGG